MGYRPDMESTTPSTASQSRPALVQVPRTHSLLPAAAKARRIIRRLTDDKADNVVGLDVSAKSACMDVVICATAKSSRHARSLADALAGLARADNFEWLRMEGYQNGEWILVDMNDVIVHIFLAEIRELFQIEALWRDAPGIEPGAPDEQESAPSPRRAANAPVPTLLLILDGYGLAPDGPGNAAAQADTPTLKRLLALPERVTLEASGRAVGLPAGFMGNSEVGHLNIGAGRIVYQDMTRIDIAVENGELAGNPALVSLLDAIKKRGGKIHFAGLLSDGGVHSHINHLKALLKISADAGVPAIVHGFTDGRDTPPSSAVNYVRELGKTLAETGGRLGTLVGRYYAMDRDKRWERVSRAWDLLIHGQGERAGSATEALTASYASGKTDEFLEPLLLGPAEEVCLHDGDGLFMFNFRADRGRELASAFVPGDFAGFDRGKAPDLAGVVCMTSYDASLPLPVAFPKDNVVRTLGEIAARQGWKQLRIAETEKYAHVTYFLSGGREMPFDGEDRILVNSPKDVATYDLKPEMSVYEVTDKLLKAWESGQYTFVACNLANPDMVGHTGVFPAALKALEAVDACVARIEAAVAAAGGRLVLTADHGNVEMMIDPATGQPHTAHTTNPVPLLVLEKGHPLRLREGGKLGDIAPTMLAMWGIRKPVAMTGDSLYIKPRVRKAAR